MTDWSELSYEQVSRKYLSLSQKKRETAAERYYGPDGLFTGNSQYMSMLPPQRAAWLHAWLKPQEHVANVTKFMEQVKTGQVPLSDPHTYNMAYYVRARLLEKCFFEDGLQDLQEFLDGMKRMDLLISVMMLQPPPQDSTEE
jgi:hypothetical protein